MKETEKMQKNKKETDKKETQILTEKKKRVIARINREIERKKKIQKQKDRREGDTEDGERK